MENGRDGQHTKRKMPGQFPERAHKKGRLKGGFEVDSLIGDYSVNQTKHAIGENSRTNLKEPSGLSGVRGQRLFWSLICNYLYPVLVIGHFHVVILPSYGLPMVKLRRRISLSINISRRLMVPPPRGFLFFWSLFFRSLPPLPRGISTGLFGRHPWYEN